MRFKGFSEGWDNLTLNSMVKRVKSYSLSRDVETSKNTGFQYIHYGDIHKKVANIIDLKSNLPNIQPGNYELLKTGDLILADASEDYQGIATPAIVYEDLPYKLVAGLHTIALRPESKRVDSLFLYYLINSQVFRKHGYRVGSGMKVFGISATNILKFEYVYPTIVEQTQIGNFFKQLDETIAFQQQELDTLKQTKQGFLQKMFPKEGESVPEIRFSGFSSKWCEQKLKKVFKDFIVPMRDKPKEFSGTIPWTRIEDIEGRFINGTTSGQYVSEEIIKSMNLKIMPKGSLIVSSSATFGIVAIVTNDLITNQTFIGLVPKDMYDIDYLYVFFKSVNIQKKMKRASAGSTIFYISRKQFEEMIGSFPTLEEQTQIGNFFKQLDETIALHEQELNILKQTKKAFLQKMFV
ncbi:restriction endonuclease subunit S [Bacillus altitudinis]|nr:restriction endonuclease subunit S [Bacillus altitudinis]